MTENERRDQKQRERLYRGIIANSNDPIALVDGDGTVRFVSDSIERLTGFTPAELVGHTVIGQVHPDDQPRFRDALHEALARPGVPVPLQYRGRHRDGSWRDREIVGVNRLHDPDIKAIIVNYRDTTARRRAEAALEESERVYRSTFDEAPIGVAHTSLTGKFLRVNEYLCQLLGYASQELTRLEFTAITHPDEIGRDVAALRALAANQMHRYTCEKRYRRKDGSFVLANLAVGVHRDRLGEASFFIAVIEDLTERKRLEQELREAHKMEAIGRLAGGIAHDFNNLLTAIDGYAGLALEQLTDDTVRRDVEEIRCGCRSAASLTRQLLVFSRRQPLQPQIVDINVVARGMEGLLRRLIGEHIEIAWRLESPIDRVIVDTGQIEQVILNVALNGRDAMPGGGTLTIETANILADTGPHVMLAIGDTGTGIDETAREHLFEPFYTTKDPGQGTGLGLATVYAIVKQSGGSISIDSERGSGTTFKVLLPSAAASYDLPETPTPLAVSLDGTETILLVEDQPEVLSVAREALTRHGYTVVVATNADQALTVDLEYPNIDLLVTDLVMPGMSGTELARRFRRGRPGSRVLFMSGYVDGGVERHGAMPSPLISKPFDAQALLFRVRELLDQARSIRAADPPDE